MYRNVFRYEDKEYCYWCFQKKPNAMKSLHLNPPAMTISISVPLTWFAKIDARKKELGLEHYTDYYRHLILKDLNLKDLNQKEIVQWI